MHELLLASALVAALSALVTGAMVPLVARIALAVRAVDYPSRRRAHARPIPRLGGIALASGLILGIGPVALLQWGRWPDGVTGREVVALVAATGLVFLVGLVDDTVGRVGPLQKLAVQVASALLVVAVARWRFSVLGLPGGHELDLGLFSDALSVVWIVGVTNAITLIDGLDGLAGGVAAIIAVSFLVYAVLQSNLFTVLLMAGISGACLGFLRHNWHPAKIFLGDSGSLTLGFLLAAMSVHSSMKATAVVAIFVPILALGLPAIDTLLVMAVRFVEKPHGGLLSRGARMFRADRNHLHHLLMSLSSCPRAVLAIYGITLCFCTAAMTVAVTRDALVGVALFVIEVGAVAGIRWLGFSTRVRRMAREKRDEGQGAALVREGT